MKNIYRIIFIIVAFIFFIQTQQSIFCQENSSGIKLNVKVGMPFGTTSIAPEGYDEKYKEVEKSRLLKNQKLNGAISNSIGLDVGDTQDAKVVFNRQPILTKDSREGVEWIINKPSRIIPPSPNSSALINETKFTINKYSGGAHYSIPLHQLKSYEISLPISLNYTSNGIKVDDIASWVGLGWNLSAGGSITRVANGLPDEFLGTIPSTENIILPAYGYLNLYNNPDYPPGKIDISNFENEDGLFQKTFSRNANWQNLDGSLVDDQAWDTEPDEFYFNFHGYSGMFVFTQTGDIITIPHQNFEIVAHKQDINGLEKIVKFEVFTPDGYTYTFGDNGVNMDKNYIEETYSIDQTRIVKYGYVLIEQPPPPDYPFRITKYGADWAIDMWGRTPFLLPEDGDGFQNRMIDIEHQPYTSTWHLKQILSKNGDFINFNYRSQIVGDVFISDRSEQVLLPNLGEVGYQGYIYFHSLLFDQFANWHLQQLSINHTTVIVSTKHLTSINTKSGNIIEFHTSDIFREDLFEAEKLQFIKIKNNQGNLLKQFELIQDYSQSAPPEGISPGREIFLGKLFDGTPFYNHDPIDPLVLNTEYKRMFLKSLTEVDEFYNKLPPYKFVYDLTPMPRRVSYMTDIFGYFNDNDRGTKIPKMNYPSFFDDEQVVPYQSGDYLFDWDVNSPNHSGDGAILYPNESKTKAGSLLKVITPGNGAYEIKYELNRIGTNTNYGLRVKSTKTYPNNNNPLDFIKTNYTYSEGTRFSQNPLYQYTYTILTFVDPLHTFNYRMVRSSSNSIRPIYETKGSTIGYGEIKTYIEGQGATYENYDITISDNPSPMYKIYEDHFDTYYNGNKYPFVKAQNMDWKRGKIKESKTTKLLETDVTYKTEPHYNDNHPDFVNKYSYGLHPGLLNTDTEETANAQTFYYAGIYTYESRWMYNDYTTETNYSSVSPESAITTQVNNTYEVKTHNDQQYTFLQEKTKSDSKGAEQKISYKYPLDINNPSEVFMTQTDLDNMLDKNMLNTVLKTVIANGSTTTDGQITTFRTEAESNMSLPSMSSLLVGNNYKHKSYYLYDNHGNIVQSIEIDGAETIPIPPQNPPDGYNITYLWGYNYTYPIAKIENATYDAVIEIIVAAGIDYVALQAKNSDELKIIFKNLIEDSKSEDHVLHNSIISAYTYDPLIGTTSEMDPNGIVKTYDYDNFNRLITIRDEENIILKHIDYNYFEPIIEISPESFIIENDGGTFQVDISSNVPWVVTENSDFLSLIPPTEGNSNGSFQFHCSENTDIIDKTAEIIVAGDIISKTISITQLAADHIIVSPDLECYLPFSGNGSCLKTITSNVNWTAEYYEGDEFYTFSPSTSSANETSFRVYSKGPLLTDKTGKIIISGNGITVFITVTQDAHP